ncbi:MAG: hypothetical protein IJ060_12430 [Oscillospiraceae bacterium]|nr:hypothetical protein [Oscillospiraceae bacterium]MBQ8922939.1 hypothetical protein [Oscillospiraceae bacterium]
MKFCKNCGRVIGDNEQCQCGFGTEDAAPPVQEYPAQQQYPQMQQPAGFPQPQPAFGHMQKPAPAAANPKKKTGIVMITAAILLAAAGALVWFLFLHTADYEQPVKDYFSGINKKNYKTCTNTWTTEYMFESLAEYSFEGSISECRSSFNEFCSDMTEEMEDFYEDCEEDWGVKNISYSYKITDKEKLSRDDLRDIEEENSFMYRENELKEGYELKLKVTVKGSGESDSATGTVMVVKSSREGWKLVAESADGFEFTKFTDAEDMITACMDF